MFGPVQKGASRARTELTAEMLLALLEEQIVCLERNIQNMFSSLNFQETWFRVMALIPKKTHPRGLNEFRPISCLTTFRKLLGVHLVTETAASLLEDTADSFHTAQTGR